ncbi:hypothetical protein BZM27_05795 [Paraburkholderia steynii]|uniref:Uncharacterized protein n=1 Tax=Paraburkholderia steynii TaxID=1245441 RepID=A0A4R0XFL8_9BURK|nr:hypothetical protein BZM27_05795 [Paraburkholderia steynii]
MIVTKIDLPLTDDDRDDTLTVNFAVWPPEHSGQAETLEIIHAHVNAGDMPSEAEIKRMVWAWIERQRNEI